MEIRRIEPSSISLRDAIELADTALDAFRDDPLFSALHMTYDHPHYQRVRLSYALLLLTKVWRKNTAVWVALQDRRAVGYCRWDKVPTAIAPGVAGFWIWLANAARWLVDLYATIFEPPEMRPLSRAASERYFSEVAEYFAKVARPEEPSAFLGLMCVRESHQGQGIASGLLSQSMAEMAAQTPPPAQYALWATTAGLGLYKKHGFQVRAEHSSALGGRQQRSIYMLK